MTGPGAAPPAPWDCRLEAVVWWHRARPGAAAAMPAGVRVPVTVGAFVRYLDTPVGTYHELAGCPALLLDGVVPAGHVAFIAVDSAASLRGGRENWALPKIPAAFAWADHGAIAARDPAGAWALEARVRARGLRFALALAARCVQMAEDGQRVAFPVRGRGLAAPARVRVAATGAERPGWLAAGVHAGVVVRAARLRVGRPAT